MKNGATIRVLIVDDEPAIRESLAEYLHDHAFEVSKAENAEMTMQVLKSIPHQVAIIDLRLPGMDGENLILEVHDRYPTLQFLIHTGSAGYQLPEKLQRIGIRKENILLKPILDLKSLVDSIKNLAGGESNEQPR